MLILVVYYLLLSIHKYTTAVYPDKPQQDIAAAGTSSSAPSSARTRPALFRVTTPGEKQCDELLSNLFVLGKALTRLKTSYHFFNVASFYPTTKGSTKIFIGKLEHP